MNESYPKESYPETKTAARGLMTTMELASYLRVTTRTIANLLKRRKIPVIRVGSINRYQVDRVVAALEEHHTGHSNRLGTENKN